MRKILRSVSEMSFRGGGGFFFFFNVKKPYPR